MSVIVAAAGTLEFSTQLSAAGVERIVAYHSSAYRQLGLPSVAGLLPWASANEQTLTMLPDVLAGAGSTPVLATVCANDGLRPAAEVMAQARDAGAVGVLNAPTVGLLGGPARTALEAAGLGRSAEIALIAAAAAAGLEAWAYVFDAQWTAQAVDAGATGLIVHLGITTADSDAATEVAQTQECLTAAAGVPVLLHGGSLREPAALTALLDALPGDTAAGVRGFMGASAFERSGQRTSITVESWRHALDRSPDH